MKQLRLFKTMLLMCLLVIAGNAWGEEYVLVESALSDWRGDYLIAYSDEVFMDGSLNGGTAGVGKAQSHVNPESSLSANKKSVSAEWGNQHYVTIEAIDDTDLSKGYVIKSHYEGDGATPYFYYANNTSNGMYANANKETAATYPINVNFKSNSDIRLELGGNALGSVLHYNKTSGTTGEMFRFYKNGGQEAIYLYKKVGNAPSSYALIFANNPQGTFSASVDGYAVSNGDMIEAGKTISISASPGDGYAFNAWNVYRTGNQYYYVTVGEDHTFVMPEAAVTIDAYFIEEIVENTIPDAEVSLIPGMYNGAQSVTITNADDDNYLYYYTLDGTTPAIDESMNLLGTTQEYSGAIEIAESCTLTILTTDLENSKINTFEYQISTPHTINFIASDHGTFILKVGDSDIHDGDVVLPGTVISLTATPADGYKFGSWNVTNTATSESVTVTDNRFTMPSADVNVNATFIEKKTLTLSEMAESMPEIENEFYDEVKVTRSITAGNWGTLCLPFDMSHSQIESEFGAEVELLELVGFEHKLVKQDTEIFGEDPVYDDAYDLKFMKSEEIHCGVPCLIQLKNASDYDGVIEVHDVVVNTTDGPIDVTAWATDDSKCVIMHGNYVIINPIPADEGNFIILDNKFQPATSSASKAVKGFRAYVQIPGVSTANVTASFVEVPTKYKVTTVPESAIGSISASSTQASKGETVTLTANPADGYEFVSWNVTYAPTGESIEVTGNTFIMPAANVNVSAVFRQTGTIIFGTNEVKIDKEEVSGKDNIGNTWTIITEGTTSFTANQNYYQVGSSKVPATSITFTTNLPKHVKITSFSAKFGGFSGTVGDVSLTVDGTEIASGSLNGTTDVTVSSTVDAEGTALTVTVTKIDKGVKCYNISYTYEIDIMPAKYSYSIEQIFGEGTVSFKDGEGNEILPGDPITENTRIYPTFTPADGYEFTKWEYFTSVGQWKEPDTKEYFVITKDVKFRVTFSEKEPTGIFTLTPIDNIFENDEVLIVHRVGEAFYAMSNDNGTSSAPTAVKVTVTNNQISEPDKNIIWKIGFGESNTTFSLFPKENTDKWLYCTNTNNGVRVGTGDAKDFQIKDNYLYENGTTDARYIGVYNGADFRCYTSINSNIENQILGFYVKSTRILSSIRIKTSPRTEYTEGESFDPTSLVVTLHYEDGVERDVTYLGHEGMFSFTPSLESQLTTDDKKVLISVGGKSVELTITVGPAPVYDVKFSVNGDVTTENVNSFVGITLPTNIEPIADYTFAGWSLTEMPDEITSKPSFVSLSADGKFVPSEGTTLYAVYTRTVEDDGTSGEGVYRIYGNVKGTKHYMSTAPYQPAGSSVVSTAGTSTDVNDAIKYTITKKEGSTDQYSISFDYEGTIAYLSMVESGTNKKNYDLRMQSEPYYFTFSEGAKEGTTRIISAVSDRALAYRDGTDYQVFKIYSTVNLTASSESYYDPTLEQISGVGTAYYTTFVGYTRDTTKGNYGTLCMPCAVKAGRFEGATLYSIAGRRTNGDVITSIVLNELDENESLVAGRPYVFQATASKIKAHYNGPKAEAGSYNGLVGALEDHKLDNYDGIYVISGNKVKKFKDDSTVVANRAYIDMKVVPDYDESSASAQAKIVEFGVEDGVTGVSELSREYADGYIYNLNGQRVSVPVRGQIYIQNGNKFIAK